MGELITIGKIVNTHGLKGEVKVIPFTDDTNRFKKLKEAYINGELMNILSCKMQPGRVILKIEGINSIEEAEKFKNRMIEVSRDKAVKLPEGSFYVADLIECDVYDEEDNKLGKVFDVIFTGSNEVYWVKGEKEVLVPAIKDIVLDINIEEKKIIIKNLEKWQCE